MPHLCLQLCISTDGCKLLDECNSVIYLTCLTCKAYLSCTKLPAQAMAMTLSNSRHVVCCYLHQPATSCAYHCCFPGGASCEALRHVSLGPHSPKVQSGAGSRSHPHFGMVPSPLPRRIWLHPLQQLCQAVTPSSHTKQSHQAVTPSSHTKQLHTTLVKFAKHHLLLC